MNLNVKYREKLLALMAAGVVGLLILDSLVLTPLANIWRDRSERITQRTKDVSAGRLLLARENAIRDRWEYMQQNALPNRIAEAEDIVIKAVDRWAQASQLPGFSIRTSSRQHLDHFEVDCNVDGELTDINKAARFLYEFEKDPLPVKLEHLDITSRDSEGRQLRLTLRLSGLVLIPTER